MFSCSVFRGTPEVGHFTQMLVDRASAIGCAMIIFPQNGFYFYIFTCDYSSQTIIGFPIYKQLTSASECTKMNPDYPALCSADEPNNPNKLIVSKTFSSCTTNTKV
jgi:hypothetical protein